MLSKTLDNDFYNPTVNLTQQELMDKFNLAFYEGQSLSKSDILTTFPDETIEDSDGDYHLVDYFLSASTPSTSEGYFDFDNFVNEAISGQNSDDLSSSYYETPSINNTDSFDLSDIELCETLSSGSVDIDNLVTELQDLDEVGLEFDSCYEELPTVNYRGFDFNNFLKGLPDDNLNTFNESQPIKSDFGHLIGNRQPNNNCLLVHEQQSSDALQIFENHLLTTQNDALKDLHDDPLLSSSSLAYPTRRSRCSESESSEDEISSSSSPTTIQCQWQNCYQIYENQVGLVKHIEKCHVEVKRGDEFTCFWANCPRNVKPFNARYKLLIHMRVHSGEKPNKCMFEGCNKAFSRLENLKIHQRSHTGERPYLCQFPTCSKSFSNSSDRAKHQRTHFDTKPYACQVAGCPKKYTDPSSLRKHVKNHTSEEQMLLKKKPSNDDFFNSAYTKKFLDPKRQKAIKSGTKMATTLEHNYSNIDAIATNRKLDSSNIRQDLKNKISEKNKLKRFM